MFNSIKRITEESALIHDNKQKFNFVIRELNKLLNKDIENEIEVFDVINNSTFGTVFLVYCSLTEYILLYRIPFRNSGYTGRYMYNIWDFLIYGSYSISKTKIDSVHYENIEQGSYAFLPALNTQYYEVGRDTLILEYARGIIPSSVTGILSHLFSTFDILGTINILYIWSKCILKSYYSSFKDFYHKNIKINTKDYNKQLK